MFIREFSGRFGTYFASLKLLTSAKQSLFIKWLSVDWELWEELLSVSGGDFRMVVGVSEYECIEPLLDWLVTKTVRTLRFGRFT